MILFNCRCKILGGKYLERLSQNPGVKFSSINATFHEGMHGKVVTDWHLKVWLKDMVHRTFVLWYLR